MSPDTYSLQFPFIMLSSVDPVESEPGSLQVLGSAMSTLGASSPVSTKISNDIMVCASSRCLLLMRLPHPPLSMDECVDDQHYNDSVQNDHPIGKFNARYRCLFAKPFHDRPPVLDVSKYILSALATPASVSALSESTY